MFEILIKIMYCSVIRRGKNERKKSMPRRLSSDNCEVDGVVNQDKDHRGMALDEDGN